MSEVVKFETIFTFVANSFSALSMFVASVFISQFGGKEVFGFFSVVLGIIIVGVNFSTFGLDSAIVRFVPGYRYQNISDKVHDLSWMALANSFIVSALIGLSIAILLVFDRGYSWRIGLVVAFFLPIVAESVILQSCIRASGRNWQAVFGEALVRPFIFIVILFVMKFGGAFPINLDSILFAYLIALIGSLLTSLSWVLKGRFVEFALFRKISFHDVREWLGLGFSMLMSSFSTSVISQAPVVLAGVILSAMDAGEFGASMRFAILVVFALNTVNSVISPVLSRVSSTGSKVELQIIVSKASAFSMMVATPVCGILFFFAPELLKMFGKDFDISVYLIRILLAGWFVNAACGSAASLLSMTGHHRVMSMVMVSIALIETVGLFFAMKFSGSIVAAVVAAIAIAGYPIIMAFLCKKRIGVDPSILSWMAFWRPQTQKS